MKKRGTNEGEITQAINESTWRPARDGRIECTKDFTYNDYWNGKFYSTKQVKPVFKDEAAYVVIITVYVFYF